MTSVEERRRLPVPEHWRDFTVAKALSVALICVWLVLLILTALYKIYENSLGDYFTYFTNWSWTLHCVLCHCD